MDSALAFGIPGVILLAIMLMVLPIRDYLRIPATDHAGKLAHLFVSLWIRVFLGSNPESFFFPHADPVWFCKIISVIDVHLTTHLGRDHSDAPIRLYPSSNARTHVRA